MPSPLGHGLAGLIVHVASARDAQELRSPLRAALLVGLSEAPDLDLLLRLVDGASHHQHASHSVGMAAIAAVATGIVAWFLRAPRPGSLGLLAGAAWALHVVLDSLGADTSPPYGPMSLWPFSQEHYISPYSLFFLDIQKSLAWRPLLHDLKAAAWEATLLLPPLVWLWRAKVRRLDHGKRSS